MRSILLRSLAVIGAGGLVLAGVLYVASTVDARPPEVLEMRLTQPMPGDPRRALITTTLEVIFSEPVDEAAAARAISFTPPVAGSVSWSGSTMIFTPRDPLRLQTGYAVRLEAGVRDLTGNEMSDLPPPFEFETAGRPELVEASPGDGATDVPLDEPIALTFSALMDTASVEAELRLRPTFAHELRWSRELLEIVPTRPMRPGTEYRVTVQAGAADVAGVTLAEPISLGFRTIAPGLAPDVVVPADGIDGIAPTSPIAVIFDRPIDPSSVSGDLFAISPEVAGSLELDRLPDEPLTEDGAGSVLRFTPSGPLAPNTTFEVELLPGLASTGGGRLAGPIAWSFTTGARVTGISNQVTFITDRAGVDNVWAMNPDGSGKRQLSAELAPVLDYAVAPDGGSLVLGDGRRLVYQRADGSDRRILTDEGVIEFDPAYAPDGQRVAFARADALTGAGRGLWEWEIGAGDARPVILPPETGAEPAPSDSASDERSALRAPRYSPDGSALAFVDLDGWVGLLELPSERVIRVPFDAGAAPLWLSDSASVLLTGTPQHATQAPSVGAPVGPLVPGQGDEVFRLLRAGSSVQRTSFGAGAHALAVSADGTFAYRDAGGRLWLSELSTTIPGRLSGEGVVAGTFAPGEPAMVIVVAAEGGRGSLELLDTVTGRRVPLAPDGSMPRWLP